MQILCEITFTKLYQSMLYSFAFIPNFILILHVQNLITLNIDNTSRRLSSIVNIDLLDPILAALDGVLLPGIILLD